MVFGRYITSKLVKLAKEMAMKASIYSILIGSHIGIALYIQKGAANLMLKIYFSAGPYF